MAVHAWISVRMGCAIVDESYVVRLVVLRGVFVVARV